MNLRDVARETLSILDHGHYRHPEVGRVALGDAHLRAARSTRAWSPRDLTHLLLAAPDAPRPGRLSLWTATTQVAAHTVARSGARTALLNFASAKNPGGGFLSGARAQEEDLARCSALYPCLSGPAAQPYYTFNRSHKSHLYSDWAVLSLQVPFFRSASDPRDPGFLLEAPFHADVITAPAPNAGALRKHRRERGEVRETLRRRAANVLTLAVEAEAEALVLGAWGCGVFRNDPTVVAETFAELLESGWSAHFEHVVFAIPARGGERNLAAFARRLDLTPTSPGEG